MIAVDTNVVSERWASIAVLPEGTRKRALEASLESVLNRLFAGRRIGPGNSQ